jgi:hypothetical protein
MLHIILGILKLIGILLGILLLLLLALVLAVLLVPLRYRVEAEKQEDRLSAQVKVSWLLHLVSASASINGQMEHKIVIRLFGIALPLFQPEKEKRTSKKKRKDPQREYPKQEEPERRKPASGMQGRPSQKVEQPSEEGNKASQEEKQKISKEEAETGPSEESTGGSAWNLTEKISSVFRHLVSVCKTLCRLIAALLRWILNIPEWLEHLAERAGKAMRQVAELLHRPQELLDLAEKLEVREVLGHVSGYLKYLIRHYAPRRIRGFLRFGTGDPALTGELTGLIYLILPVRADQFRVESEFTETVFETELLCSGHIRVVHLIWVFWQAFRDQKLRRLIRYAQKKR